MLLIVNGLKTTLVKTSHLPYNGQRTVKILISILQDPDLPAEEYGYDGRKP